MRSSFAASYKYENAPREISPTCSVILKPNQLILAVYLLGMEPYETKSETRTRATPKVIDVVKTKNCTAGPCTQRYQRRLLDRRFELLIFSLLKRRLTTWPIERVGVRACRH